jgi:hypothetical protein
MAHALLSPSGAPRWVKCVGSVAMEQAYPATTSDYADEGTVAHHIAALCMKPPVFEDAAGYKGRIFEVSNGTVLANGVLSAPRLRGQSKDFRSRHEVTAEMVAAVNTYVSSIRNYSVGASTVLIETKVPIDHITGEEGAEGTADAILFKGSILQVHDLKYGKGVRVSPETPQLALYALGALRLAEAIGFEPITVRCYIHQPRITEEPQWCEYSTDALLALGESMKEAARKARSVMAADDAGAMLTPDEKACQFCAARRECPARRKIVEEGCFTDFEVIVAEKTPEAVVKAAKSELIPVAGCEDDWLSRALSFVGIVEDWCKDVRTEAFQRLSSGVAVPFYKLVQGKGGARKWADEKAAESALKGFRLKVKEMYDKKLISPTSAEKVLKELPKQWAKLQPLISKGDGKPTVVEVSDPRPALVIGAPEDDFQPLTNAEDLI